MLDCIIRIEKSIIFGCDNDDRVESTPEDRVYGIELFILGLNQIQGFVDR